MSDTVTPQWRCFHCDETFSDPAAARLHFGNAEWQRAICTIDVAHFRWMEAQHQRNCDDASEALRTIRTLAGEHERLRREAEELGYARGLRDAQKHPEELGLTRRLLSAVPDNGAPPLYPEHDEFEALAKPLLQWLSDTGNPELTVIVNGTRAEILEHVYLVTKSA